MADDSSQDKDHPGPHDESRRRFLKGVGIAGAGAALADKLAGDSTGQVFHFAFRREHPSRERPC
jgi:hypothetical protein